MATKPTIVRAVPKTKNTAKNYNDNFDAMMDFIDESIGEAKDYVDDYMPAISSTTKGKFLANDGTDASWVSLTGTIAYYGGSYAPEGWLVCDGSAISRTTYADLYNAIGTSFGAGDESTTFNLPNLIDKFAQGNTTVGTLKDAGLPNIAGNVWNVGLGSKDQAVYPTGAFTGTTQGNLPMQGGWDNSYGLFNGTLNFSAANSNSIYGGSTTVQPPAVTALPIIKY